MLTIHGTPARERPDAYGGRDLTAELSALGMIGCDFTVVEPPELVDYLNELGRRLVRAASGL